MDEISSKLLHLYDHTPVLVAVYDSFDRLRYANEAFRSAFFVDPDEMPLWPDLMRRNYYAGRGTVIRERDFEAWLTPTLSRRGKIGFRAFETDLVEGRWLWMTETVDREGWMLCIANDITKLRASGRSVRQDRDLAIKASNTDDLTGVANRRFVIARLEEMLRRSETRNELGCVSVIDLDNFKYVNDRFGHPAGDIILRDFAARIQREVRRSDCFGRVGGEEFLLVLPNTSMDAAELIVERMLAAIRGSIPLRGRPEFGYTFSAGIATAQVGDIVADVLARADSALYSAKIAGRNRIHLAA
ncbi:GGDEF domain-containing protein [Mesorhizobium sangaii]|uniref:diguanylate cyclase n=1 Tax=Mesorhizobium sangaii TaxID=505389 RepID=A0A841P5R2_9HYPH|nr:GGDEF domain-containing protein [Mesorhizobium sangaii]MBB6410664.1 diguanylate cyclase (GGDEF)-like protein [Mesorhizobium sangaii]